MNPISFKYPILKLLFHQQSTFSHRAPFPKAALFLSGKHTQPVTTIDPKEPIKTAINGPFFDGKWEGARGQGRATGLHWITALSHFWLSPPLRFQRPAPPSFSPAPSSLRLVAGSEQMEGIVHVQRAQRAFLSISSPTCSSCMHKSLIRTPTASTGTHKNTGCSLVSCRAINIYDTYNKWMGLFSFFFVFWSFWKIDFAQGERRKMRLYVLTKPWVTAKLNIEILFILRYNSFPQWLYLPVSSASGYTAFQFRQLIRVSSEWRELNFSNGRGAQLPWLPQGEKLWTAAFKVSFNTFSV